MSDFTLFATLNSNIRQLQYFDGKIYASNSDGNGTTQINVYSVSTSYPKTVSIEATVTSTNISIALVAPNTIYLPTYQLFSPGDITQIIGGLPTIFSGNLTTNITLSYLLYDSNTGLLLASQTGSGNFYSITIDIDTGTSIYTLLGTVVSSPITSMTLNPANTTLYILVSSSKIIYVRDSNTGASSGTISLTDFNATNYTIEGGICFDNNYLYFAVTDSTDNTTTMHRLIMTGSTTGTLDPTYNLACVPPSTVTSAGSRVTSIVFDNLGSIYFAGEDDANIYSTSDVFCFNKGTKILCMNQQLEDKYIPIENLNVGDFVKTYKHGYRKVSKTIKGSFINNPKKWNMCMYKMAKTVSNGLIKDLIVTGGHSILVDSLSDAEREKYSEMGIPDFANQTIDNKHLVLSCVSDQFVAMQDTSVYHYYHLILENNDDDEERFGIWANGVLTETPNVKTVSK
jgi:hypothetical protein